MTAKTLEKLPVNLGGFVHPAESVYSMDDIATSLPTSVAIFPNSDLGAHYDQINVTAGKRSALLDYLQKMKKYFYLWMKFCIHTCVYWYNSYYCSTGNRIKSCFRWCGKKLTSDLKPTLEFAVMINHVHVAPLMVRLFCACRWSDERRHERREALSGPLLLLQWLLSARVPPQPDLHLHGKVLHRLPVSR